jgi:hypothetical protein
MILAGTPATKLFAGTSFVTTAPAPTTEFSPTVTPPSMVAAVAIHTFVSIAIGFPSLASASHSGLGIGTRLVTVLDRESIDACARMLAAIHRRAEMRD